MNNNYQLAERLQSLRKSHSYSQEQLADLLGISRQAVSKWESGNSQPDIDNLVRLSQLYGESLDSLVTGAQQQPDKENQSQQTVLPEGAVFVPFGRGLYRLWHYEYKSKTTLWGLPLVHIHCGRTQNGRMAVAKGIVAVGTCAIGLLSVGAFSLGLVSVGAIALGLLTLAVLGGGFAAAGILSVGVVTFGIVSLGYFATGVAALGVYSNGVAAVASQAAVGVVAVAPAAIGKEKADGLHTMLADASTTVEQAYLFLQTYAPKTPEWILKALARAVAYL